jgi:hypothetical protein
MFLLVCCLVWPTSLFPKCIDQMMGQLLKKIVHEQIFRYEQ